MICDSCLQDKKHLVGAVVEGKFGQYCYDCIDNIKRPAHVGSAQYQRDRDRDAHEMDLLQPWDAKGNPNTEFIRRFPEESKDMFSQKELEQFG